MSGRAAFAEEYGIDTATLERFDVYAAALAGAQERMNLVASSTLAEVWTRHFADSAQLLVPAASGAGWLDLGAGAGFPGLVLALLGARVEMVEATGKKAAFLADMVQLLGVADHARVHHGRIESIIPFPADTITARALAPLPKVFDYGLRFASERTRWVLPKGTRVEEELGEARKSFVFEATLHPSRTAPEGRIVVAHGVRRKG